MKKTLLFLLLMVVVMVAGCQDNKRFGRKRTTDDWFHSPINPANPLSPMNPASPNNIFGK